MSISAGQLSNDGINRHIIYTDGGCHNGKDDPMYGIGSFAWLSPVELSQGYVDIDGCYTTGSTNNITEMKAVIYGIRSAMKSGITTVKIISDSGYLVNGFTLPSHLDKWVQKGWRLSTGDPVKNRNLWEELLSLSWHCGLSFELIKGHNRDKDETHAFWNDICDRACTYIMTKLPAEHILYHMRYHFSNQTFEVLNMEVIE